jgi:glycerol transport system ATP-binding protein
MSLTLEKVTKKIGRETHLYNISLEFEAGSRNVLLGSTLAMVYQQFINYPSLTVYKNIASPLKMPGIKKAEIDRRVRETAETLHIADLFDLRWAGAITTILFEGGTIR